MAACRPADDDQSPLTTLLNTFSVDYGTTGIRVSHRLSRLGDDPDPYSPQLLRLQQSRCLIPSSIGFCKASDGTYELRWGAELEDVLRERQPGDEEIFELRGLKICMYPTEIQGEHRRVLEEQLNRYNTAVGPADDVTLEAVIEAHLTQIRHRAVDALVEKYRRTWTRDQLERIPQQWSFTVPEIATLATNQRLTELIRNAGYPKGTMLMTETEAAAGWLMHEFAKIIRSLPDEAKDYHAAIILDAGGLTANISGYRIVGPITAGAAVQLELVDKAGLACGSETLTKLLLQHVEDYANIHPREHPGGFAGVLESLSMTRMQAESYLSAEFDSRKGLRVVPPQLSFTLMGHNRATGQDVEKCFRVSRETYHGWLRNVSGTIIDKLEIVLSAVNDQLARRHSPGAAERPRLLMLTGGLMRNHFIVEQIQANFRNRNVEIHTHVHGQTDHGDNEPAVALGASLRTVPGDPIFSQPFALGQLRDEPYTRGLHDRRAKRIDNPDGTFVQDCWSNLLPLGAVANCNQARASWEVLCTYLVTADDPVIRDTVWLSRHAIKDHTTISARAKTRWAMEVYLGVEERIEPGRLAVYAERVCYGEVVRTVTAKLVVTMELTQIELKVELVDPGFDGNRHDDDRHLPPSTALRASPSVLHDTAFPSAIQRNPLQRRRRLAPAAEMPSPARTASVDSPATEEEFSAEEDWSDGCSPPPPKRAKGNVGRSRGGGRDGEYRPRGRGLVGASSAVATRARRRKG